MCLDCSTQGKSDYKNKKAVILHTYYIYITASRIKDGHYKNTKRIFLTRVL